MTARPLVLSSPSGGGKTSIAKALISKRSDCGYSVSCTTRSPRPGEVDGVDYHFWTEERFRSALAEGAFVESAVVHGNLYGTLAAEVRRLLDAGLHVVLDIDVQGAARVAELFEDAILVFVLPPSAEVLVRRLRGRGSEDESTLRSRIRNARAELLQIGLYDYVVVNAELERAVTDVELILDAEMLRSHDRKEELVQQLSADLATLLASSTKESAE